MLTDCLRKNFANITKFIEIIILNKVIIYNNINDVLQILRQIIETFFSL